MNRAESSRMLVMACKRLADSSYPQVSQEGRLKGKAWHLQELSHFVRQDDRWYYRDGVMLE